MATQTEHSTSSTFSSSFANASISPQEPQVLDLTPHLEEIDGIPFACGGYADLYKYRCCTSIFGPDTENAVFAVKSPRIKFVMGDRRKSIAKMRREIAVWASLNHENVLRLHGQLYRNNNPLPSLVADFMEKGTADNYIRCYPEADLIELIRDIAKGLSYIHGQGISHGDIKADNILVGGDGKGRVADFGLSRMLGSDGLPAEVTTTDANRSHRWHAVEYFNFVRPARTVGPTKPADVWSLGCTVLQLFSGSLPYHDAVEGEVAVRLSREELPKFPPYANKPDFEKYRTGIVAFCRMCWVKNPDFRPQTHALEELACSDFWDETCIVPARRESPPPSAPSSPWQEFPRSNQNIEQESTPVNVSPTDGFRSRSSSQATVVATPTDEEDIKVPVTEPPEEFSPPSSPESNPTKEPEAEPENHASPINTTVPIPSQPPPSLEEILRNKHITPQEILNEAAMGTHMFTVQYLPGESTGPSHLRTHAMRCMVNDEEYGIGVVPGKKKQAKERAALMALRRLYLEKPELFSNLRYSPVLTAYLQENNLTPRATWNRQSGPSPSDPTKWEHRVTFMFDGNVVTVGIGSTANIAEEHAARRVGMEWSEGIANTA